MNLSISKFISLLFNFPSASRVAHFFKNLGRKKFSQSSLALHEEQAINVGENEDRASTVGLVGGNTLGMCHVKVG